MIIKSKSKITLITLIILVIWIVFFTDTIAELNCKIEKNSFERSVTKFSNNKKVIQIIHSFDNDFICSSNKDNFFYQLKYNKNYLNSDVADQDEVLVILILSYYYNHQSYFFEEIKYIDGHRRDNIASLLSKKIKKNDDEIYFNKIKSIIDFLKES